MAKSEHRVTVESASGLELYCQLVLSGEIVACKKLKKVCKKLLHDLKHPYKQWHYDADAANRAVEFIETFCKIPSGRAGQPFKMELYEIAWTQAIFGFVDDDGARRYQEVFIEVGRKNGKSSWVAAIEMYMLIADGEFAPQIYNVATTQDQAKLAFNACNRMRLQSAKIGKHVKKNADGQLYCDFNMGYIMPLASNPTTLDGLDVHCGVLDEIHAMRSREVYDLVRQGMQARTQPLLIQITTNGFTRNSIFDAQYEYATRWLDGTLTKDDSDRGDSDRFIAFIYELDDKSEWLKEECWLKANPGLHTVKKYSALKANVDKAKNDPSYRPTVMTKDFNMPENASVAWLDFDEAVNVMTFDRKLMNFRYGICGFDASDTIDLTSAQMLIMVPDDDHIYERSMYWIPEDTILNDMERGRHERDDVPYQQWISRGLMQTVAGNKIDKRVLLDWLTYLRDEEDIYPFAVGYDPWHMDDSTLRDLKMFVGKNRVIPIRQGPATLSQPMKQLRADYKANRIVDNHNPINEWCRMNVMIRTDVNANIAPDKKNNNPKNRIDGFMAELDGYVVLCDKWDEYQAIIEI